MGIKEHFSDIMGAGDLAGHGVFESEGAREHTRVREKHSTDGTGVDYSGYCGNCGQPFVCTISWGEFIVGSVGNDRVPPREPTTGVMWIVDHQNGGFMPPVRCPACSSPVTLIITPDECARHVKAGIAAGRVDAQQAQQLVSRVQQR